MLILSHRNAIAGFVCKSGFLLILAFVFRGFTDDWPHWQGPARDGVWREKGIVSRIPATGLKKIWSHPIGGGYSGPSVAHGKVVVTDRRLAEHGRNPEDPFQQALVPGFERVLCLDAQSGKAVWTHEYPCDYTISYPVGPRSSPCISDGRVFTLGAEGHLHCLDLESGKVVWMRDFKSDFDVKTPQWGFSAHPLVLEKSIICMVGGEDAAAVAFNKKDGSVLWKSATCSEPGYCPPTLIRNGDKTEVLVWHADGLAALDPDTGSVSWEIPWKQRFALAIPTPRQVRDRLFFTSFYNGSLMLKLKGPSQTPEVLWQTTKASEKDTVYLHSIMSTPLLQEEHIYGVCSYGQLRCLKQSNGERVWENRQAVTGGPELRWGNAFIVKLEDRFILFNEKGDLILAELSPQGYEELGRANLLSPTSQAGGRDVVWSHPAFAYQNVYARNDLEIVCYSMKSEGSEK